MQVDTPESQHLSPSIDSPPADRFIESDPFSQDSGPQLLTVPHPLVAAICYIWSEIQVGLARAWKKPLRRMYWFNAPCNFPRPPSTTGFSTTSQLWAGPEGLVWGGSTEMFTELPSATQFHDKSPTVLASWDCVPVRDSEDLWPLR
jgi:hypothetical protein